MYVSRQDKHAKANICLLEYSHETDVNIQYT